MSGRSPRFAILLWTCALAFAGGADAAAQYRIDTWTTEQGLPQNAVTDILQTRDGFLWLTTFGGLVRFDGANMHVFTTINAPGMRSSRLTGLFEAPDGALWIASEAHGAIRYRDGVFATYDESGGLPDRHVFAFFVYDGAVYADTAKGPARWDGAAFTPCSIARPTNADPRRPTIGTSASGAVWFRENGAIHRFANGAVTRTITGLNPRRVYEDRQGRLWMESQDRRLQCLTATGLVTYTEKDGVPSLATASFSEDRDGTMWFGFRSGAAALRFDGRRFTQFSTADGLPSNAIGKIVEDREGTHWVATDSGLVRLTYRSMISYTTADGLEANNTYAILQDSRGDLLIGGWQGLTRYHDGAFTPVAARYGVAGTAVMSLAETPDHALWIGTWGDGVHRTRGDGSSTRFAGDRGAPGTVVRALLALRDGTLLAGGPAGLSRFENGAFRFVDGYADGEVHTLMQDRAGRVWIGTDSGVVRWQDGRVTRFGGEAGLTGPVRAVYEDADGAMWFGTYDAGLFRLRDGRFRRFTTRDGLFANGAFRIIEDAQDRFWISSNSGIYRVWRRDLNALADGRLVEVTSVPYGRRDGMRNAECNGGSQPAGIRAADGRIWMPTQEGVVVFDPGAIPVERTPPPVVITSVLVADQAVPVRDAIEIRNGPPSVEVQYAALTFIRPELTRFRYRIEGLDANWIDVGQARAARFAQLPYGTFDFHVIAANRDGVWNTAGAHIRLVVVPPFWRTWWFAALGAGLIAMAAFATHRARVGHLRRQAALRAQFSRQLIDTQERDRRRIAAGLHDGLSQNLIVIRNWALLGRKGLTAGDALGERLSEIESAATVALGEVREVVHDLAPHNLERLGLAQTIEEMAARVGAAAAIPFTCRISGVDGRLPRAAELNLYRIVQEAVNNVVKHSGAQRAWIEIEADGDTLRIHVRDNGHGFDPQAAAAPRDGGFGLFGMSERLRMIGGHLVIHSMPGKGTDVAIDIPLRA